MALAKSNKAEETPVVESEAPSPAEDVLEPEEPTQVVAPTSAQQPPAVPSGAAMVDQMAAAGFSGLHIDWTSFPTIVLDKGEFCTSDGNNLEKQDVNVRIMQTRARYVLRTKTAEDDDAELAYTYNMGELLDPESDVAIKVAQWTDNSLQYDIKEYIEAVAMVEDEDHSLNEQMVLLQIPPTSTGRFSGFMTSNQLSKKKMPPDYITRCYRGEKVTKAKKPFYPWAFEYVG